MRARSYLTEKTGRALVHAFEASGKRPGEFAAAHGVTVRQLAYWRRQCRLWPTMIPVVLARSEPAVVEVVIGRATLRLTRGFDAALVAEVVRALETGC